MDVTKVYRRNKISKSVRIKQIDYNDSKLASDSDTEKRIFSISLQKIKSFQEQTVKVMMKQFTMELIKKPGKKLHRDLTWRRKREMGTEAKSGQYAWDKETKQHLSGTMFLHK
jgi:hypothetical protein